MEGRRCPGSGHCFPQTRRETLWAQVGSTHVEAGARSSNRETQGTFLFDGPKDLGKEITMQDGEALRDGRQRRSRERGAGHRGQAAVRPAEPGRRQTGQL